jgi:hypothetical protein
MYQTRGYPIDFELRRAHRARRRRRVSLISLVRRLWTMGVVSRCCSFFGERRP